MSQNKKIEIACFNLESALIAQNAGADRVELCADVLVGGTTPTIEVIQRIPTPYVASDKVLVLSNPSPDNIYKEAMA